MTVLYYTAGLLNTAVCHLAIFTLAQSAQFVLLRGFFSVFFTNTLSCHAAVAVMQLTTMPLFLLLSLLFLEKMWTHYKSRIAAVYPTSNLKQVFHTDVTLSPVTKHFTLAGSTASRRWCRAAGKLLVESDINLTNVTSRPTNNRE